MNLNYQPAPRLSEIVRRIEPSLVHIRTSDGSGSGFVIDAAGYIITNAHVVGRDATVSVEFIDGITATGTVLGRDEEIDLACVQISNRLRLEAVETGDSDAEQVGEDVVVMGFPLGDRFKDSVTVTRGIISAKRSHYLQTDAAINPGNSGGPLVNVFGQVIGVNTWGIDRWREQIVQGIGFAIPINVVMGRLSFLVNGGVVDREEDGETKVLELVTHHYGKAGFSLTLPAWWSLFDSDEDSARFSDGRCYFSISFILDAARSLRANAVAMRESFMEETVYGDRRSVTPLQPFGRGSWSFSYDSGSLLGQSVFTNLNGVSGNYRPILTQLHIPRDSPEEDYGLDKLHSMVLRDLQGWEFLHGGHPFYKWGMVSAPGWYSEEHGDYRLSLWSPDKTAILSLSVLDLDDETSVQNLCRDEVERHLDRVGAWEQYEVISAHMDDYEGHHWYRMNYRYQGKNHKQAGIRITQVGRSGFAEYVLHADMNEVDVPRYSEVVNQMVYSFWFYSRRRSRA